VKPQLSPIFPLLLIKRSDVRMISETVLCCHISTYEI